MQTNATELLDRISPDLFNKGKWAWTDKNGTKARLLTAIQKMIKAKMSYEDIKQVIIELETAFYIEHDRSVKNKTGLSVRELVKEFIDKKPIEVSPPVEIPIIPKSEEKIEEQHEPTCTDSGS